MCVIPEFPIRYGTLGSKTGNGRGNQSFNVDFSVWDRERRRVFLVELKTDMGSLSPDQLKRMVQARDHDNFNDFVDGIIRIALATKERRKYAQLIWRLHEVGAMCVPCGFRKLRMEGDRPGLGAGGVLKDCRATGTYVDSELVLVSPCTSAASKCFHCIDFCQYADAIQGTGELENTLAEYVRRWRGRAGRTNPWRGSGS